MLLVRDGQEDAIIHGNRTGEESGSVFRLRWRCARLCRSKPDRQAWRCIRPIARLKRNPSRLRSAVGRTKTGIAYEHLARPLFWPLAGVSETRFEEWLE